MIERIAQSFPRNTSDFCTFLPFCRSSWHAPPSFVRWAHFLYWAGFLAQVAARETVLWKTSASATSPPPLCNAPPPILHQQELYLRLAQSLFSSSFPPHWPKTELVVPSLFSSQGWSFQAVSPSSFLELLQKIRASEMVWLWEVVPGDSWLVAPFLFFLLLCRGPEVVETLILSAVEYEMLSFLFVEGFPLDQEGKNIFCFNGNSLLNKVAFSPLVAEGALPPAHGWTLFRVGSSLL